MLQHFHHHYKYNKNLFLLYNNHNVLIFKTLKIRRKSINNVYNKQIIYKNIPLNNNKILYKILK